MKDLDAADESYERAEAAYLAGIRAGADRASLMTLATELAEAADTWNTVAYERFHAASDSERADLDVLTERTEVLSELWRDVRDAYRACKAAG